MRPDMFKVIVERPRIRGEEGMKFRHRDIEDAPQRESLRKRHRLGWDSGKQLNENLAPLERFIGKQVNRPWNKVWSEICAQLRVDSTVQQHVRDHVSDFISIDCEIVEPSERCPTGVMTSYRRRGSASSARTIRVNVGELYVHPDTGIILKARRKLKGEAPKAPSPTFIAHDDGAYSAKINGIWYDVKLVPVSIEMKTRQVPNPWRKNRPTLVTSITWKGDLWTVRDAVFGSVRVEDRFKLEAHYGRMARSTDARQLPSKALRERGLRND